MSFDPDQGYRLHTQVALRPEPFGALAYHYGNRRLTFIKSAELVALVRGLGDHATAAGALDVLELTPAKRRTYEAALQSLEASEVISAH